MTESRGGHWLFPIVDVFTKIAFPPGTPASLRQSWHMLAESDKVLPVPDPDSPGPLLDRTGLSTDPVVVPAEAAAPAELPECVPEVLALLLQLIVEMLNMFR